MTQSLFLYWQRLTQRAGDLRSDDGADRAEAPVLDLAGCFGSPVIRGPVIIKKWGPEAIVAKLAEAVQTRPATR